MSRVPRVVGLLCVLSILVSAPASGQKLVAAFPAGLDRFSPQMNASGTRVVVATDQRLTADDTDAIDDVYVFTVAGGTWQRLPRTLLVGRWEAVDSSVLQPLSLSDDGRYLAYETRRLRPFAPPDVPVLARFDITANTRVVVRDAAVDPFTRPVMSRDGSTFAWLGDGNAVIVATVGQTPLTVGQACPPVSPLTCERGPQLTARGERVLYLVGFEGEYVPADRLEVFDRTTNRTSTYPEFRPFLPAIATTATGDHVYALQDFSTGVVFDLSRRTSERIATTSSAPPLVISDDGRYVLVANGQVYDRRSSSRLGSGAAFSRGLSSDGRIIAVILEGPGLHALLDLDGDDDGIRDPWETVYGLDPSSSADAALDPDGDGVSNRDEFARGSHPRATHRRYFAEGVTSAFFQTILYTFSNLQAPRAPVTVTFTTEDGRSASRAMTGPSSDGLNQATLPPVLGASAAFSMVVESDVPVAAERITTWPAAGPPRGAHASSGVAAPSLAWTFAEGATRGGLQTFYLLANPGALDAEVSVTYLCADVARIGRTYRVPARGRTTVWVNQEGAPLDSGECGASMVADRPIVAERSVYLAGGAGFTAGTSAMGLAPDGTSFKRLTFVHGATADPFDMFLALVNPSIASQTYRVTYLLPGGVSIERTHLVAPERRLTIWVEQEDARLASADRISIVVDALDGNFTFAERAMWWRGADGSGWVEGHVEHGATATATRWAMAHVPESASIAILNTSDGEGVAKITLYSKNGVGAAERVLTLPPGLTTVRPTDLWPALGPDRYSALVESLPVGAVPAPPLIVERTAYIPGTPAGTTFLATPVP